MRENAMNAAVLEKPFATMEARKDTQTVSPDGIAIERKIFGVAIDYRPLQEDERGELQEIFNPAWGLHPDPMVYAYFVGIRPGQVKGWVVHQLQDDRLYVIQGVFRIALFDDRPESPTYKKLNVFVMSERKRGMLIVPKGVFHALKNIGAGDAHFINLPTRAYDHGEPDKFRLPLKNDLIPFAFDDSPSP
jgi:dTDP-4-dehydrorhamnose 3,5-epimerase